MNNMYRRNYPLKAWQCLSKAKCILANSAIRQLPWSTAEPQAIVL